MRRFLFDACGLMTTLASIGFCCEGVLGKVVVLLGRLFSWTLLAAVHLFVRRLGAAPHRAGVGRLRFWRLLRTLEAMRCVEPDRVLSGARSAFEAFAYKHLEHD